MSSPSSNYTSAVLNIFSGVFAALLVLMTFLACMATKTVARLQVPCTLLNIMYAPLLHLTDLTALIYC